MISVGPARERAKNESSLVYQRVHVYLNPPRVWNLKLSPLTTKNRPFVAEIWHPNGGSRYSYYSWTFVGLLHTHEFSFQPPGLPAAQIMILVQKMYTSPMKTTVNMRCSCIITQEKPHTSSPKNTSSESLAEQSTQEKQIVIAYLKHTWRFVVRVAFQCISCSQRRTPKTWRTCKFQIIRVANNLEGRMSKGTSKKGGEGPWGDRLPKVSKNGWGGTVPIMGAKWWKKDELYIIEIYRITAGFKLNVGNN